MMQQTPRFPRLLVLMAIVFVPFAGRVCGADAEKPTWLGPIAVAASQDGKSLFVGLADAKQVAAVDVAQGKVVAKVDLPGEPTILRMDAKSGRLYVSCVGPKGSEAKGTVVVVDPATMKVVQQMAVGHTPTGLAVAPDGTRLFVCNRFNNDVSVLSLPDGKELARVKVTGEPVDAAITPDGKTIFVINLTPTGAADGDATAAQVTTIDSKELKTADVPLPNGSSSVRGICLSPDGKYVLVTHILSRNGLPTTQLERGWMNTNALSILDAQEKKLIGTILLDDIDLGAATPWGVACSADGATLCVTHSGTDEVSLIDVKALFAKLAARAESLRTATAAPAPTPPALTGNVAAKWDISVLSMPLETSNDLSFMAGLRKRIALPGKGPRGVVLLDGKAYAAMYFSDALAVVDLNATPRTTSSIALGPAPEMTLARRGEMLFHDATLCFQHWQSCASCHPDARVDALNWDLMNDGFGNPKNTKSMLLAHRTPPAMSESVRESAEMAVRAGFKSILFRQCSEEDAKAVDAYLKSLQPVASPHLVDGALSPAAVHGQELFASKQVGCAECHPAPLFTDLKSHNVGTRGPNDHGDLFDTPTLIEVWRTAPYLHDGSRKTLQELIGKDNHGKPAGEPQKLTEQEVADLIEYVLSL